MKKLLLFMATFCSLSSIALAESGANFSWYCTSVCETAGRFSKYTGVSDFAVEGYGNSKLEAFGKMSKGCKDGSLWRPDFEQAFGKVRATDLYASPNNSCNPQQ
jgi:hypothetical protein